MTELLLIRHGETDFNRQLRFQGHIDVPLNANGQAQADRLALRLADEPLDLVLSSDLERARQTAAPLVALRGLPMSTDAAWREQAFGVIEGLTVAEIRERHPQAWQLFSQHDADSAAPGGESTRVFHARVLAALQALARAHAGQRVAVLTHGGVLDRVWRAVHGLPLAGPRSVAIPNTGLNRLRWDGDILSIVHWADDAHLADMAVAPVTIPLATAR